MVTDVALSSISMYQNYRDVEPPSEKDEDVIDLSKSIKKHGVMQPVLLREDPKKKDHFQLIFGHRRFLAAKLAGLIEIPASVKPILDEDILEVQVTENLQRKDVHPMDEAVAFKKLIEQKKYSVDDVAARFAKKPEYIVQRLKFNDLIPELQTAFKKGFFLAGHALLLARLTPVDQKEVLKDRGEFSSGDKRDFGSVIQLQEFIDENITRELSKAPFKTDDATLFPQAGACGNCTKRSGCGNLLFADLKEDDRCFDKSCYENKKNAGYVRQITEIIETKPEIKFVADRFGTVPQAINKLLQEHKIPLLKDHNQYSSYNYGTMKLQAKAFIVNGYEQGQIKTIYLPGKEKVVKGKAKSGDKPEFSAAEKKELISGIQQREKRAKELDIVKSHKETIDALDKKRESVFAMKAQPIDRGIMIFLLLENAGLSLGKKFKTIKGLPESPSQKHQFYPEYFTKLSKLTDDQVAQIVRLMAWDKYGNRNLVYGIDVSDTTIRLMAEYGGIDLKKIDAAQAEIASARQGRVKKRISDLSVTKKEKPTQKKKEAPAKANAPSKKSAPQKATTKKAPAKNAKKATSK